MARITDDSTSGQANHNPIRIQAEPGARIDLPSNDFVSDSHILRDGQDLILQTSDGSEIIVENYFITEPAPMLVSSQGAALTPDLVDSFVKPLDGIQLAQKGTMDDASPIGMVKESSGDATITHANGISEKASVGSAIYQGDIVETKGEGAVNIMFVDDTTFAVSENARLAIDEYVFDPATQSGESNFSVMHGVFVFTSGLIGREDPDDVKIDTPVGSIGIRGTTIMGTIDADGESQITVVEGAIVVSNDTGEQTLSQQYETVTLSGYTGEINNQGQLTPEQIGENYTVLRTVSAQLFSQIDDGAKMETSPEGTTEDGQPAQDGSVPVQPDADSPLLSPAETETSTDPVDKSETTESEPTVEALASESIIMEQDAGFDTAAGTETLTMTTSSTYSLSTSGSTSTFVMAPSGSYALPPADNTTKLAPPTTTTSTNTTGSSVVPPPPPAPGFDVDLIDVINGSGGYIPNPVAGSDTRHGASITALGDYNHDGQADFAFTNSVDPNGMFFINATPYSTTIYGLSFTGGLTISGVGDFDGDGVGDFILGAEGADSSGGISSGKAVIISGASPGQFYTVNGFSTGQLAAHSVSGIGDFDGDGFNDLILGAPTVGSTALGSAYVLYGTDGVWGASMNAPTLASESPDGFKITAGSVGTHLGAHVSGAGDFNKDGFSDFAISEAGLGSVKIFFGNSSYGGGNPNLQVTNIIIEPGDDDIPFVALGDMNGDGTSDFGIAETGTDTLHIFYGSTGRGAGVIDVNSSNVKIVAAAGSDMVGGGFAGDFNGDGFDDVAVALRTGDMVDIYVVYGKPGLASTINPELLPDRDVFHMTLDLSASQFNLADPVNDDIDLTITTAGDRNEDGFDELMIGIQNIDNNGGTSTNDGGILAINGRAEATDTSTGKIMVGDVATMNGQTIINQFNNAMSDSPDGGTTYFTGLNFKGLDGDDFIAMHAASQRAIDGGSGIDTLAFMASNAMNIDLRMMDDNLENIEIFSYQANGMGIKIGIDDIFRLLQESEDGWLKFDSGSYSSNTLQIDSNDNGKTSMSGLGFSGGTDTDSDGFAEWHFGGYTLLVDTDLAAPAVGNI